MDKYEQKKKTNLWIWKYVAKKRTLAIDNHTLLYSRRVTKRLVALSPMWNLLIYIIKIIHWQMETETHVWNSKYMRLSKNFSAIILHGNNWCFSYVFVVVAVFILPFIWHSNCQSIFNRWLCSSTFLLAQWVQILLTHRVKIN